MSIPQCSPHQTIAIQICTKYNSVHSCKGGEIGRSSALDGELYNKISFSTFLCQIRMCSQTNYDNVNILVPNLRFILHETKNFIKYIEEIRHGIVSVNFSLHEILEKHFSNGSNHDLRYKSCKI